MIRTLGTARLKTGERLRIAAVEAPAGRYAAPIRQFLGHKGQPWMLHVDLANQEQTDDLRTTYYVGFLGRDIAGNVMIVDDGRVGILGHVFTAPAHRRNRVCQQLMAAALDAFRARGGSVLTLGTGYDSAPYWIYHGFGFRSVEPGSGHMILETQPGALARCFVPSRTRSAEARWHHWPGLSLLFMQPCEGRLRSVACQVFGPDGFEGGFLELQSRRERLAPQVKVLLTPAKAIVGAAILQRDSRWPAPVHTLDLCVHPHFERREAQLLRSLRLPRAAKVQAYLDRPSASRVRALREAGFRHEATLRGQLAVQGRRWDVLVFSLLT